MKFLPLAVSMLTASAWALTARADGAADNNADTVRRMPPPGVPIPAEARDALTARTAELQRQLAGAAAEMKQFPERARLLPDVEIFVKAVDWALRFDEFYDAKQVDWAREQLAEGEARLAALRRNETPWLAQTGLVVRGYRSRIDDSVQPFGLVVPPLFNPALPHRWRLNAWFHGRGEKLTELDFIHQRMHSPGEFTPADTLVLHPYGRYCNGSRFAGETDFFEALDAVTRDYRVDDDRIVVRGFSLGGAACWHIAAHHASRWCAAAPGAGFSETEEFLTTFQGEALQPAPWERKLWSLHDATAVAGNFLTLPLVAYSGEIDRQKQAADAMARALEKEGLSLTHIIGPKTAHAYEPGAKAEINRRINILAARGRTAPGGPSRQPVSFTTYSLRYNQAGPVTIDQLGRHWSRARVDGQIDGVSASLRTENIVALTLRLPPGARVPGLPHSEEAAGYTVSLDGSAPIRVPGQQTDRSLECSFHKIDGTWKTGAAPAVGLRKTHGLQGPVDDAFMDRFLYVRPTGAPANAMAGAWVQAELARAIDQWRRQYRGDVRIKDDGQVTDEDIRDSHLVLWGDPSSNSMIARIAGSLPIAWSAGEIIAGERRFAAASHALIAIHPNPLNPAKYVVLNSGFTFREYDQLNNARQTPKLPDWAVIDLTTPAGSRRPGRIAAADFFGEHWELTPPTP